ncbi:MAG: xanthine dehydrogenase large subunit, partial [Maribacter sp.]
MKNIDSFTHVRGESLFVDDLISRQDALIGLCFDSPKAHGKIISVDYSKAEALEGVERIFTYKDVLGENQIGGIIPDEPLWAENEVHF